MTFQNSTVVISIASTRLCVSSLQVKSTGEAGAGAGGANSSAGGTGSGDFKAAAVFDLIASSLKNDGANLVKKVGFTFLIILAVYGFIHYCYNIVTCLAWHHLPRLFASNACSAQGIARD